MDEDVIIECIFACLIIGTCWAVIYAVLSSVPNDVMAVPITDLVDSPQNYTNRWVTTKGYLGDTGKTDFSLILVPMIVSTGKTTIVIFVPISDTDYYMAVYVDNCYAKGILCNFETKPTQNIGEYVTITGKLVVERMKIDDVLQNVYILKYVQISSAGD